MGEAIVSITRRKNVAIVTLNRAERRNAFNEAMWQGLEAAGRELTATPPRAIVLTGAGDRAFSAGMDVAPDNPQVPRFNDAVMSKDVEAAAAVLTSIKRTVDAFMASPAPIIAAVNGLAYGGGAEIAARCDMRVADPRAVFCFSEVRLGLMPDIGGGVALTRLLGPGRAADLILTARKVGAEEALRLGLVDRLSSEGGALDAALELAEAIAANGPRAVRSALDVIRQTPGLSEEAAIALEQQRAAELIASGECVHGITAFFERKTPTFPDPED